MKFNLNKYLGVLRSVMIYYGKPFNKRKLKRFYRQFIQPDDLCFDIGAHLGNRSDAWISLGARVIAVEPQPACISFLKKKLAGNPQFSLIEKAVGKQKGKAVLHISSLTPTVSTLASADWRNMINDSTGFEVSWDEKLEVEVITLNDLINEYGPPAFCKIDVENFELEVLQGLAHPVKTISFEFFTKTPDMTLKCIQRLEAIGRYEFNYSFGESQKMVCPEWLNSQGVRKQINNLGPEDPASGDLYARLIN
jgi:FkbM family methyltransferase